ncbi:MAG: flagellar hook capping FlgD N-terminal domain-containing protein, partial [Pseudomonadales bacterium]
MNEVNSSTSVDVINSLDTKSKAPTEEQDLDKDAFLRLMIAQLQNQDPLSPAKIEDCIA